MADLNIGEIATTTLRHREKRIADNVSNHNALFQRLKQKGNIKPVAGGRDILENLEYASNSTAAFISGYEVFNTTPQDVIDAANFDWKEAIVTVVFSNLEMAKNSSKEAIIDLIDSRIRNAEHSLMNTLATSVHSDGTGSSGKEIGGLQLLVADDPTASSTVGGIQQSSNSFWQNQYSASAATSAGNIKTRMNALWITQVRGTDKPDLIVMDSTEYNFYEASLQQYQRFDNDGKTGVTGFQSLKYKTADVVYDDQCTAKRVYLLNTDYIKLRPHSNFQFKTLDKRQSINQLATVIPLYWMGNMTVSNRSLQGVMIDD